MISEFHLIFPLCRGPSSSFDMRARVFHSFRVKLVDVRCAGNLTHRKRLGTPLLLIDLDIFRVDKR